MRPALLGAAVALPLLVSCSVAGELGTRTMSADEVASEVEKELEAMPGIADGTMECADDLEDEVGQEVRCTRTVTGDGVRVVIGVSVEVVEPDEDGKNLNFKVDDEPRSVTVLSESLEKTLADQFQQQLGRAPDDVSCPELPGKVGEKVTCDVTDQGKPLQIEVTATQVEGTEVNFRFEEKG